MKEEVIHLLNRIAQAIYDKKGFNILCLDVKGISTLTDYVIIAEGNIDRHLKALSFALQDALVQVGRKAYYVEGEQAGDWIVIDYGEIVVHLLLPEFRERYSLEELWKKAGIVDLQIDIGQVNSVR